MTEYQKIPGPFLRDPKTHQLLQGKWSTPELELLANQPIWNITEKVDGTNLRIYWDGHRVSWRGRTDTATFSAAQTEVIELLVGGSANETLFEQKFGADPVIVYGELYGPGVQSGGKYNSYLDFVVFDVMIGGLYLERHNVEDIAESLGLNVVPLLAKNGTLIEAIQEVQEGFYSTWKTPNTKNKHFFAEGVVGITSLGLFDRRGRRIAAKIKHEDLYNG